MEKSADQRIEEALEQIRIMSCYRYDREWISHLVRSGDLEELQSIARKLEDNAIENHSSAPRDEFAH